MIHQMKIQWYKIKLVMIVVTLNLYTLRLIYINLKIMFDFIIM